MSGAGTIWALISAPPFINCHKKEGKLLNLLASQFLYQLNGDNNRTISWGYEDYMQYWAGIEEFNKWNDDDYY